MLKDSAFTCDGRRKPKGARMVHVYSDASIGGGEGDVGGFIIRDADKDVEGFTVAISINDVPQWARQFYHIGLLEAVAADLCCSLLHTEEGALRVQHVDNLGDVYCINRG